MVTRTAWVKRLLLFAMGIVSCFATLPARSIACDTPVYRYAMYRWTPTPYELYYFHEDFWQERKYSQKDTEVHKAVEDMAADLETPANAVLLPVNLFVDQQLRGVPPDVRKLWAQQKNKSLPQYMLISPQGARVYGGDLNAAELASLTMSPTRTRLADLLADGRSGVFLLLGGKNAAANEAAEKILNELAADVAAGKIDLYKGPQDSPQARPATERLQEDAESAEAADNKEGTDQARENSSDHRIGVVTVARDDPKERWLVEMLLAVESDLKDEEFEDQPMVFVVYGRARALPPYIGKGITRDNMLEVLDFITSACSCTVKEQNPGVDLLARYDWEAASEKLADRFGSEEGNESFYGPDEFFPELIVGSADSAEEQPSEQPQEAASVVSPDSADPKRTASSNEVDGGNDAAQAEPEKPNLAPADVAKPVTSKRPIESTPLTAKSDDSKGRETEQPQVASLSTKQDPAPGTSHPSDTDVSVGGSWVYTLVIGIGVGLIVLIGASFLLFNKR